MNRRTFLRRAGLSAGAAVVGAGAAVGVEERRADLDNIAAGHAVGSGRPPGLLTTTINYRVLTSQPVVALTFDDGPTARYTARILDILERADVRATFFQIGMHVRSEPALARRVAQRHEIGNHTWSHPSMGLSTAAQVTSQLVRTEEEIYSVTGRRPVAFRPPYGAFSGATAMIATSMRYPIMLWDMEFDQHGPSAAANVERLSTAGPGSILLGHDGGTLNCDVVVEALPALIERLRDRGLSFATVPELLALSQPPPLATPTTPASAQKAVHRI